jgi:hypothetical protein
MSAASFSTELGRSGCLLCRGERGRERKVNGFQNGENKIKIWDENLFINLIDSLRLPTVYPDSLRLNNNETPIVAQFIIDNHRHHIEI